VSASSIVLKMPVTDPIVSQGHCARESPISDKNDWETVCGAFSVIGFTEADLEVKTLGFWVGGWGATLFSWGLVDVGPLDSANKGPNQGQGDGAVGRVSPRTCIKSHV
jgi:hypothetical protein